MVSCVFQTQPYIGMPSFSLCQNFTGREILISAMLFYAFRLECIFLQQIGFLLFTVVAVILSQICSLAAVSVRCSHELFSHCCMSLSYWSYVLVQAKLHYAETHMAMLWLYLSVTGKRHQIMCDALFLVIFCHKFCKWCGNWREARLFATCTEKIARIAFFGSFVHTLELLSCSFSPVSHSDDIPRQKFRAQQNLQ